MAQKLTVLTDINAVPTGGLFFPEDGSAYNAQLAAGVEQTLTIPLGVNRAVFSFFPQGVWVTQSDTALTLPGATFGQTQGELDPIDRAIVQGGPGVTSAPLRFIATNSTEVGVRFFVDAR